MLLDGVCGLLQIEAALTELVVAHRGGDDRHGGTEADEEVQQIADMFGVLRSTVYGHLDKTRTVPRQPKKPAVTKP